MNKIKQLLVSYPEFLLIAIVFFYWFSSGTLLNPIAIGVIVMLIVQLFLRNGIVGVVIPILLMMTSIFLLLALFSEYGEFSVKNAASTRMLIVGVSFILLTITASGLMLRKYSRELL